MGTSPSVARTKTGVLRRCLIALLLLAPATGCRRGATEPLVLFIAAEGLDPALLEERLAADDLPNIQRLVDRGSLADVRTPPPGLPPVVWTTVATGVPPAVHGIGGFVVDGLPARSTQRQAPAFWNLLPRLGVATAVVGWPVTWPAEPESGFVVSDRAHLEAEGRMEPPDLVSMASRKVRPRPAAGLDRFTSFVLDMGYPRLDPADPAYRLNYLVDLRLNRVLQRDRIYEEIALEMLTAHDLDLLALGVRGLDSVSHGFLTYLDPPPRPGSRRPSPADSLAGIIPAYYRYLDDIVGRLLRVARREPLVILMGDHGVAPARDPHAGQFVSGAHREVGALIISGAGVQRGVLQTRPIAPEDLLPTLLWITGHPQADDLPGRPLREYLTSRFRVSETLPGVPSYRDALTPARRPAPESTADALLLEEIAALGYRQR
jgi:hypothetical protein